MRRAALPGLDQKTLHRKHAGHEGNGIGEDVGDLAGQQIGARDGLHLGNVEPAHHGGTVVAVDGEDGVQVRPDGRRRVRAVPAQGDRAVGNVSLSASFTLHEADYGAGGVVAIRVHRTFSLGSTLHFTILERPVIGSVRVFDRAGAGELVYLASNDADAREWLTRHGYPHAMIEEVTADEVGADVIEGRAA